MSQGPPGDMMRPRWRPRDTGKRLERRWIGIREDKRPSVLCRESVANSLREHLGTYLLGSLSSAFLTASQYLAVSSAVASYLPVDPGTSALITSYGRVLGIILVLLLNSLVFQGILGVLVVILAVSSIDNAGWKWAYAFSGVAISGFVGYWLGA